MMAAEIPKEKLKKEIHDVLKDADMSVLTSKKIRLQLEEKFSCDLFSRKEEIDKIIMAYMNDIKDDDESNSDDDDEEDSPKKQSAPVEQTKSGVKRAKDMSSEESSGSEDLSDDDYSSKHSTKKPSAKKGKKMKSHNLDSDESESDDDYSPKKNSARGKKSKKNDDSDDGSNEEWKKPKPVKKAASGKAKGTGFTRPYTLSPALAELMGAESLPRHEVVKKVWAIIKERNLYDPKNKQFAICDSELQKVMGVKRFRTFGMLKYLKQHFIN